jgi:hypothetical protein
MSETVSGALPDRLRWSSSSTSPLKELARSRRRQLEVAMASVFYLGFACYLTWPLVTDLSHSLYGAPGDPYGTIAFWHTIVAHGYNPFLPGTIKQFGAPAGIPVPWPRDLASAPGTLAMYVLSLCFGAVAAFGLYTLAGYTLTGIVTFLFVRRLTHNPWAALIAGWAFAFYPFAGISGQGHIDFVQGWVLMLGVWRTVELMWHPTRRNGVLAGAAVVLGMWWSPYFILFAGVAYVAVTVAALLVAWRSGGLRAALVPQLIAGAIILAFLAGLAGLSTAGETEGIGARAHTTAELNFYSARALEYVVPDELSPLFGGDTRAYLERLRHGGGNVENTLYVGGTVILLALAAIVAALRGKLAPRPRAAVLALSLIVLAATITSLPPEARLFGVLVPFPSHFIFKVTETWRVYSRFVIVVMLALAALAGVGLDAIVRGRARRVRIGIMCLATVLVALDLWAPEHGHVEKLATPAVYSTLARQPPGLVAEYPLAAASFNHYGDIFHQGAYDKPLINGYQQNSFQERLALSLDVLSEPTSASRLATLGVRYVILDSTPASFGWAPAGTPGRGFRLIAHEPYADLYRVIAAPRNPALAAAGDGFGFTELTQTGTVAWLEQPSGTINLEGTCTDCNGTLTMILGSYAVPHAVTILNDRGRVLGEVVVGRELRVSLPLHFSRHTSIRLVTTPGPQPTGAAEGAPEVSISVTRPEFTSLRSRAQRPRAATPGAR